MTDFTARIAGVATLALACLPAAAIPASAFAAPSTVKVADLNLASPDGMAAYQQRADEAGRNFCRTVKGVSQQAACREGVRIELGEKGAAIRTAQSARQSAFAVR